MKETRFFYVPDAAQATALPPEEAIHAVRVLRMQAGDKMSLLDGQGYFHEAEVTMVTSKHCAYAILSSVAADKGWKGHIHLAMAPTKMMDRIEWLAEKATEVGFDELSFLSCKFSERKVINLSRIEKIVVSAMKQSRKPYKPVVNDMAAFAHFVTTPRKGRKFIAHCYAEIPRVDLFTTLQELSANESCTVMIGPEGDFSLDEVRLAMENGFEPVSLGTARLRTETAALMAVTMAQLSFRNT